MANDVPAEGNARMSWEKYKLLSEKFDHDNDHKWRKLEILLVFDGLLIVGIGSERVARLGLATPLSAFGCIIGLAWFFNVGRTVWHQKRWRTALRAGEANLGAEYGRTPVYCKAQESTPWYALFPGSVIALAAAGANVSLWLIIAWVVGCN